jgi:hypothetical protein
VGHGGRVLMRMAFGKRVYDSCFAARASTSRPLMRRAKVSDVVFPFGYELSRVGALPSLLRKYVRGLELCCRHVYKVYIANKFHQVVGTNCPVINLIIIRRPKVRKR